MNPENSDKKSSKEQHQKLEEEKHQYSGMVSQAFRRVDKYTDSQMMKINPMLQVVQSTAPQSQITTPPVSAIGGGTNDEEVSSAAISDQVTMASPFGD